MTSLIYVNNDYSEMLISLRQFEAENENVICNTVAKKTTTISCRDNVNVHKILFFISPLSNFSQCISVKEQPNLSIVQPK